MSRIDDRYLDCVVYLYASESDAEKGIKSGGSGFLIGHYINIFGNDVPFLFVVTNKHVANNGNNTLRLVSSSGGIEVIDLDERDWVFHPDGDDVAVCFLLHDYRKFKFKHFGLNNFITKEILDNYNIGPGDKTFAVGRFVNHEGSIKNLPTVRFGNIAQMPWEPIRQDNGFLQESFLVESRSVGGYSGSPVFCFIPPGSIRSGVSGWADKILLNHGPWLLGINWGHINDWQPVCDSLGRPINPTDPKSPSRNS